MNPTNDQDILFEFHFTNSFSKQAFI